MIRERLEEAVAGIYRQCRADKASASIEAFVLRNAQVARDGQPRPKGVRKGRPKQCFYNATNLVLGCPGLVYVEGYYACKTLGIPLLHAWAVDAAGNIIDPTPADPSIYSYLGVRFPRRLLADELLKNRVYGLLDTGLPNRDLMQRYEAGDIWQREAA
jgi:hypothetical protein